MRLKAKQCEQINIYNLKYYFGEFTWKIYKDHSGSYMCMNKRNELFMSYYPPKNYKIIK